MLFSVYVCQCVIIELNIICCVGVMDASVFKHIPHYAPLWFIGLLNFAISLNFCLLVACFLCLHRSFTFSSSSSQRSRSALVFLHLFDRQSTSELERSLLVFPATQNLVRNYNMVDSAWFLVSALH